MNQARSSVLPSFTGLNAACSEARQYENANSSARADDQDNNGSNSSSGSRRARQASHTSVSDTSADVFDRNPSAGAMVTKNAFGHGAAPTLLLQDTLTPLLEEVDLLFEKSKQIVQSLQAQGNGMQEEDVEVEIMERMAEAWQAIEAKNSRHDTSHKLNREKPMFCMDSLGKRIKAALLCKTLPKGDNPAEYVNGGDNAPSRNLVTAIKLAGYVVHSGTGGKVSAVDGDGREPPSKYTKDEFHNNVLPRAAENQPPRILNELRQLSCRLVASGIAKGLITEEDLPPIRKTLISRFHDGGMHLLSGGDAAFARFIGVAANAHRLLERGDINEFVLFHERVVKLVGMCRNRVRRAAYATSKNMLSHIDSNGRYIVAKSNPSRRISGRVPHQPPPPPPPPPPRQQQQQQQQQSPAAPTPSAVPSWRIGDAGSAAGAMVPAGHGRVLPSVLPGQAHYMAQPAGQPAPPFGKFMLDNGGDIAAGFGGSSAGFSNGSAIVRAAMSILPLDNMQAGGVISSRVPMGAVPGSDSGVHFPTPFHDHNALSAAAPAILTQMGCRRAPAYGSDAVWGGGVSRGWVGTASPRTEPPPVVVLQPGWGVTLPPYFLDVMDAKRPRNVPVKMLWELRAEPLPGTPEAVLIEMRQVPGYLDFLAEIMPPDMLKFRWSLRCWETLQGKHEGKALLEEAAAAVHHLGLVPFPPGSPLRLVYDEMVSSQRRNGEVMPPHAGQVGSGVTPPATSETSPRAHPGASHDDGLMDAATLGVPPVAAGVLRDLHREGALNGDGVNVWGDGGTVNTEVQRALTTAAPAPEAGGAVGASTPTDGQLGVSIAGGGKLPGGWVPPYVAVPLSAGNTSCKRKAGEAFTGALWDQARSCSVSGLSWPSKATLRTSDRVRSTSIDTVMDRSAACKGSSA